MDGGIIKRDVKMPQVTLLHFFGGSRPHSRHAENDYPTAWTPPEHIRIPGVRFAPEVPDKECKKCPYAAWGHPLVPDPKNDNIFNLLCIKDCLATNISLKRDEKSKIYELLEVR